MLQYNRQYINKQYLFSNVCQQKQNKDDWPTQPVPHDEQWVEWREFVRRNYINPQNNEWKHPEMLVSTRQEGIIKEMIPHNQQIPNAQTKSILNLIHELPVDLQNHLEIWESTVHNPLQLWTDLTKGQVQIASDGSHDPGTMNGAGAAIIMSEQSDDECIGVGSKCLYKEGMSSLTTEQYGVISGVLALIILCRCYATTNVKPTVVFWMDNEEMLS